jgi:hypothetical protein
MEVNHCSPKDLALQINYFALTYSQLDIIFLGLKKLEKYTCSSSILLPFKSFILNRDFIQCLHLKENNWLSYFASVPLNIPSRIKDTDF